MTAPIGPDTLCECGKTLDRHYLDHPTKELRWCDFWRGSPEFRAARAVPPGGAAHADR